MIPQQQQPPAATPRRRGRPVLGAVSGFFLGLFVWLDLILFGVVPLESGLGYVFPVLGIALGIGFALWAPFGSAAGASVGSPVAEPPAAQPPVAEPPVARPVSGSADSPPAGHANSPRENAHPPAPPDDDQPSASTTSDGA